MVNRIILLLLSYSLLTVTTSEASFTKVEPILIDDVILIGNEKTNAEVILREIGLSKSIWVDSTDLVYIEHRITNLNLFHRVEVFPFIRNDSTFLVIAVTEKWYIFPLPYVNWIGPNPSDLEYGFRYSQSNLNGWNRTLVSTLYGGIKTGQLFLYQDPWLKNTSAIGILALLQNEHWREKPPLKSQEEDRLRQRFYVGLSKRFGKEVTIRFGSSIHRWMLDSTETLSKQTEDYSHSFRLEYEKDRRDLVELPHTGEYFLQSFEVIRFHEVWKNRFVGSLDYRQYQPLHRNWTLSGQFISFASSGENPSYAQLRLGQGLPIRGNRDLDKPGTFLVKGALDLRWQILRQRYYTFPNPPHYLAKHLRNLKYGVSISTFYEVGQSWKTGESIDTGKLLSGYGLAFSFSLPYVNVMRIDVGFNPNDGLSHPAFFTELKTAF